MPLLLTYCNAVTWCSGIGVKWYGACCADQDFWNMIENMSNEKEKKFFFMNFAYMRLLYNMTKMTVEDSIKNENKRQSFKDVK